MYHFSMQLSKYKFQIYILFAEIYAETFPFTKKSHDNMFSLCQMAFPD